MQLFLYVLLSFGSRVQEAPCQSPDFHMAFDNF